MIPIPSSDDIRATLRAHLEELLRTTGNTAPLDPAAAEAVSSAVIAYLADQRLAPPLPDDYLHLLIYRALRTLNQNDAARSWAATHLPGIDLPVFDPDLWPGPVPLLVWQLFASRLVRPARTLTAEGKILWTLDFRRLRREEAGWLEITLLPGLRALIEQLAPAWDETYGAGLLGLRGLYAAGFAPTPRRRQKAKRHSRYTPLDAPAIRAFCLRVLAHLQTARGWTRTPDVLYLDFPPKV
ncbi:MAG TPA: hypothetical protein P5306_00780 [Kiritimatiellia bacterium]|nr:hypothetical protein [Kiritimatiellia bacterium]